MYIYIYIYILYIYIGSKFPDNILIKIVQPTTKT